MQAGPRRMLEALALVLALTGCKSKAVAPDAGRNLRAGTANLAPTPAGLSWGIAPGWSREAFLLPPAFAPKMGFQGWAEVRNSPNSAKPEAPDFASSVSVFWLEGDPVVDGPSLTSALEKYYAGRCDGFVVDAMDGGEPPFKVDLVKVSEPATAPSDTDEAPARPEFQGSADTLDCGNTGKAVALHLRVKTRECPESQRTLVVLVASPQRDGSLVWRDLEGRANEVRCR